MDPILGRLITVSTSWYLGSVWYEILVDLFIPQKKAEKTHRPGKGSTSGWYSIIPSKFIVCCCYNDPVDAHCGFVDVRVKRQHPTPKVFVFVSFVLVLWDTNISKTKIYNLFEGKKSFSWRNIMCTVHIHVHAEKPFDIFWALVSDQKNAKILTRSIFIYYCTKSVELFDSKISAISIMPRIWWFFWGKQFFALQNKGNLANLTQIADWT